MAQLAQKYSRYIGVVATVVVLWLLVYYFSDIITWLVVAWVISLLGSPIMSLLGKISIRKWRIPSSLRALLVLILFYSLFGMFFWIFVPVVVQQGRNLAGVDYPAIMQSLEEPLAHFNDWMIEHGLTEGELSPFAVQDTTKNNEIFPLVDTLRQQDTTAKDLLTTTTVHIDSLIRKQGDTVTQTNINLQIELLDEEIRKQRSHIHDTSTIVRSSDPPFERLRKQIFQYISPSQIITQTVFYAVNLFGNFLVLLTSVTFIAFFFLKDEELFSSGLKTLIPNKHMDKTDHALQKIKKLLTRYFSGIVFQITTLVVLLSTALSLLGITNAFLIAFFAALINVIPYLGPFIGGVFAILVTISSNLDVGFYAITLPMIYKVVAVFIGMQLLDGFVLQPFIFSNSVSAHPLEIFIVVIVGAKLGGATGMVIAIPTYTIIRVIAAVFLQEFEVVQKLTEQLNQETDDPPSTE